MITLRLDAEDVAATRFARSRLAEVTAALQLRTFPERHPPAQPWLAGLDERLDGIDARVLDVLVSERHWLPDFITPFPHGAAPSLAEELAAVRATPGPAVVADFKRAYREQPLPAALRRALRRPEATRDLIADTLGAFWEATIEPLWPRICAVYEGDVAFRTRTLAEGGLGAMLPGLGDHVTWSRGRLRLDVGRDLDLRIDVAGRRLALVPSVFTRRSLVNISDALPPWIAYAARGAGDVWDGVAPPSDALAGVLGRGRASVLAALDVPRATSDVALLVGLTPGAVSQHLSALSAAGFVSRARRGQRVLYDLTEVGRTVVTAAPASA